MSRAVKFVILPESMISMISLVSLSGLSGVKFAICRLQRAETRRYGNVRKARLSKILPMVLEFEIGRKFESSDFARPGFFRRGKMSASLNFDGNATWVKDKFARCEMRMERMSAHNFSSEVGIRVANSIKLNLLTNILNLQTFYVQKQFLLTYFM